MWAAAEVGDSAVDTLTELWLTRCHGNSYSLTVGQSVFLFFFFISPSTSQIVRKRPLNAKVLSPAAVYLHLLVGISFIVAESTNTPPPDRPSPPEVDDRHRFVVLNSGVLKPMQFHECGWKFDNKLIQYPHLVLLRIIL